MTAVAFDTLRFVRTLRDKAKMSAEQAEGLADAIAEAIQNDLATKTDISAIRIDIEVLRAATRTDLAEAKADIIRWVAGLIGFQTLAIIGATAALVKLLH